MINNNPTNFAQQYGCLECLAGFSKNISYEDNVIVLSTVLNNQLRFPNKKLFIDFKKACDSRKLFANGKSAEIVRILNQTYRSAFFMEQNDANRKRLK